LAGFFLKHIRSAGFFDASTSERSSKIAPVADEITLGDSCKGGNG
jgi:hypothetical protein